MVIVSPTPAYLCRDGQEEPTFMEWIMFNHVHCLAHLPNSNDQELLPYLPVFIFKIFAGDMSEEYLSDDRC